jgi:extracellular elastinolytic metalloproteinase
VRFGGGDATLIWDVFARRGMGVSATTTGPNDVEPHPGFDTPGTKTVLRGVVRDADSGVALPGVRVAVGFGEGDASPAAMTDGSGAYEVKAAPGRYDVTFRASGYGIRHADSTVGPAGARLDIRLPKNLASAAYGGKVTGPTVPDDTGAGLIDDDETTGATLTLGQPIAVHLGGSSPLPVKSVQVAVRFNRIDDVLPAQAYRVEASSDGSTWQEVRSVSVFRRKPVPTVKDVRIVEAVLQQPVAARFLRVTVTGSIVPVVEGEPMPAALTEVQAFGAAPELKPAPVDAEPTVQRGSLQDPLGLGLVMPAAFEVACRMPPAPLQGIDAWITPLGDAGDGAHRIRVEPADGVENDLDVGFYDAACVRLGGLLTAGAFEAGPIPPGAAWAVITTFTGGPVEFDVRITSNVQPVRFGAAAMAGSEPSSEVLAVTGSSYRGAAMGAALLAGALLLRRRRRAVGPGGIEPPTKRL